MKRLLAALFVLLWILAGGTLLWTGLVPFIQDFAGLRTRPEDLAPRIFRILGGVGLLVSARWPLRWLGLSAPKRSESEFKD